MANTSPCCVPAGTSIGSMPVSVGTCTVAPRAAWAKLMGTWQTRSLPFAASSGCVP